MGGSSSFSSSQCSIFSLSCQDLCLCFFFSSAGPCSTLTGSRAICCPVLCSALLDWLTWTATCRSSTRLSSSLVVHCVRCTSVFTVGWHRQLPCIFPAVEGSPLGIVDLHTSLRLVPPARP